MAYPYRNVFLYFGVSTAARGENNPAGYWTGGEPSQGGGGEGGGSGLTSWSPWVFNDTAIAPYHGHYILTGTDPGPGTYDTNPLAGRVDQYALLDFSILPNKGATRFGLNVANCIAVGPDSVLPFAATSGDLIQPAFVWTDPNYGQITLSANLKPTGTDKFAALLPVAAVAALGAGFAALEFPALASSTIQAAKGLGSGAGLSSLTGVAGAAIGAGMDEFDITGLFDSTTDLGAGDLMNNAPGFTAGGTDPYAGYDTAIPTLGDQPFDPSSGFADTTFPPGEGSIPDDGSFVPGDGSTNPIDPSSEPGAPNAPSPPRSGGVSQGKPAAGPVAKPPRTQPISRPPSPRASSTTYPVYNPTVQTGVAAAVPTAAGTTAQRSGGITSVFGGSQMFGMSPMLIAGVVGLTIFWAMSK